MPQVRNLNPRKAFQWGVEIDGLEEGLAQSCQIPEASTETAEHGEGNLTIKTAGKITFGDITIGKLMPADKADTWAWDWFKEAQDPETGGGKAPEDYKRDIYLVHYATDGRTVVERWHVRGAYVKGIAYAENSKTANAENMIETLTLSCDYYTRVS